MSELQGVYGYYYDYDIQEVKEDIKDNEKRIFSYYTSVDTAKKILENGEIWVTHSKHMNDWQEFKIGLREITSYINQKINELKISIETKTNGEIESNQYQRYSCKDIEEQIDFLQGMIDFSEEISIKAKPISRFVTMNNDFKINKFGNNKLLNYYYPEFYILSLTTQCDMLSQWKMYAGESGISISFDFRKANIFKQEVESCDTSIELVNNTDFEENKYPEELEYCFDEKLIFDVLKEVEEMGDSLSFQSKLLNQIPKFKDNSFFQESEYRFVFRPYKIEVEKNVVKSKIGYRIANNILIPYLRVKCGVKENGRYLEGWPIFCLTVGPGSNQDVVYNSLIHFIEYGNLIVYKYNATEIKDSAILFYRRLFSTFFTDEKMIQIVEESIQRKFFFEESHGATSEGREGLIAIIKTWNLKSTEIKDDEIQLIDSLLAWFKEENKLKQIEYNDNFEKDTVERLKILVVGEKYNALDFRVKFNDYCNNNHLSSRGIIIRKSRIPYLY